ncbi:hypothetical protein ES703_101905 [subsurface metagenome]
MPLSASINGGLGKIEARDSSLNEAEAQLAILAPPITPVTPVGIRLYPLTSRTSPGHVGMALTVDGIGFMAATEVTITFSNGEAPTVATATADADGNFSVTFTVPPSLVGDHTVTATDGTNRLTSVFVMESEAPLVPILFPPVSFTAPGARAHFDWEDVEDPSGATYNLQVAADAGFTDVVLEKRGLAASEYTTAEDENLESATEEAPYYWRVKVVDGAANESEWTPPGLFYVYVSQARASLVVWVIGVCVGIGLIGLVLLVLGLKR